MLFNDQITELLGHQWPNNEISNDGLKTYIHPSDIGRQEVMDAIMQNAVESFTCEQRMLTNTGAWRWIQSKGKLVARDEQGLPIRIVGTYQDITDEKVAFERIVRSNEELERFAFMASHDLQEPLRMVTSFTALLEKHYADKLDARAKEFIQFASSNAKRMQALIYDLLEYARIGKISETARETDLNSIFSTVKENLAHSIDEAHAVIQCASLPVVNGNPARMVSLFQNLIGNAIKYRKSEQTLCVEVSVSKKNEEYLFLVADNGIGMKQEYCQKIFEPFQRLHRDTKFSGTGMGLPICRKIIEEIGGRVWAESELGIGTKIWFTIPALHFNKQATLENLS